MAQALTLADDGLALKLSYGLRVAPQAPAPSPFALPGPWAVALPVAFVLAAGLLLAVRIRRPGGRLVEPEAQRGTPRRIVEPAAAQPAQPAAPAVAPAQARVAARAPVAAPAPPVAPADPPGRTATLQDLHEIQERLASIGNNRIAGQQLLERHLEQHEHTSPWILLELRNLRGSRHHLGADEERAEFARRFGVRPPTDTDWARRRDAVLRDEQLCRQLEQSWPLSAKSVIATWLLGTPDGRRPRHGMPLLTLGTYRELLFLDSLLGAREFDHPSEFAPLH